MIFVNHWYQNQTSEDHLDDPASLQGLFRLQKVKVSVLLMKR